MHMHLMTKAAINGLLSQIFPARRSPKSEGEPDSALYCYGVWMKHLVLLHRYGLREVPRIVVELGPGSSLGVGIAALLSGVDAYYALDAVRYAEPAKNCTMLDELVVLFRNRVARPTKGWPNFDRYLDKKLFPSGILTDAVLRASLSGARISHIRKALLHPGSNSHHPIMQYIVPWVDAGGVLTNRVNVVLSHAVMEHVVDLDQAYKSIHMWLKPGGMMSHQIDFTSHGLANEWNGYRAYPETIWKLIMGKQSYLINRQPYAVHKNFMLKYGFTLVHEFKRSRLDGIQRHRLAGRWKQISHDDLSCSGAFVIAKK